MEAAISCKFHCNRLAEHWQGWWPATDAAELAADIEERLAAATAAWARNPVAGRACAAWRTSLADQGRR